MTSTVMTTSLFHHSPRDMTIMVAWMLRDRYCLVKKIDSEAQKFQQKVEEDNFPCEIYNSFITSK